MAKLSTLKHKKLMAIAGLVMFSYLVLHMFSNLNYFYGAENYNNFYTWFHNSYVLRWTIIILLLFSIILHVCVGVMRQLDNNKKRSIKYRVSYPDYIPRTIAWLGALTLLAFITFHVIQMQFVANNDFYTKITNIFTNPFMLIIYFFGFASLTAHLYHSFSNVSQTMGVKTKKNKITIFTILFILIGGFVSVPIYILL